jgi:hypothetical protein
MSKEEHLKECPQARHKDSECICDLLRTVRAVARTPQKREDERE